MFQSCAADVRTWTFEGVLEGGAHLVELCDEP